MHLSTAKTFFEEFTGSPAADFQVLQQSGSSRINFIGKSHHQDFIITYNENIRENEAFLYLSEEFSSLELNTPKILEVNEEKTLYVQEFLGKNTLSEIISAEGHSKRVKSLVKQTLEKLFTLQQKTEEKIDFRRTFEYEAYDNLPITHDLYYFKNFMVDVLELPYHKSSLLKEFQTLTTKIENLSPKTIMLRDFQSRNILVNEENQVFFIDYQSAMLGPAVYDVVSFLFQAKANFPIKWKTEMLDFYFSLWDSETQPGLKEALPYCQLIRFMQVLGAYGFRGLIQRKAHFLSSIGQGIKNLTVFSANWQENTAFPELYSVIEKLNEPDTQKKINALISG
jgi:hypothetical protein